MKDSSSLSACCRLGQDAGRNKHNATEAMERTRYHKLLRERHADIGPIIAKHGVIHKTESL